ncbi:MFS transporter [Streptomyces sp. SLBN-118]|uniref:MFS transporter n=1 Tax=Streptomyces sp. SLBN-118 TaxID=2768454 RepID=UPI0011530AC4|nr:MFS transporter [Streptomyces sp. SLBN-118]TQK44148.1 MFS transporter [Streptomyces sp. SLBN-118]
MYVADSRGRPPTPCGNAAWRRGSGQRPALAPAVLALGTVSLITDISSEMVTAVMPLYLVVGLGLSPLGFGLLDSIHHGISSVVRLVGGHFADRGGRHKSVTVLGYSLSAVCKPALLAVHSLPLIGAVLVADRTGKGLRTAPRDALISLASLPEARGRAFGVHRAMDTAGALLGPLVAFLILRATVDGYDAVFAVSFCIAALGVLVLVLFVPGRVAQPATDSGCVPGPVSTAGGAGDALAWCDGPELSPSRATLRATLALLGCRDLRRIVLGALLLGLGTVSDSFIYLMMQRRLGVPDAWFALLPVGTAAVFLALAVPLGRLADRFGRWGQFLAGHVALLGVYGLLVWPSSVPLDGLGLVLAVLALHGCFYAATDGVLMAAAAGAVPVELRSSGLALVQTGQAVARFGCSLAFGAAWTRWGDHTALPAAAAVLAACALATAVLRPAVGEPPA